MQFTARLREGVRRGRIRCTVRIWTGPHVKAGGRYPMGDGHVVVDAIEPIARKDITTDLARESGFDSVADLLKIAKHGSGSKTYVIRFHYLPPGAWDGPRWTRHAGRTNATVAAPRSAGSTFSMLLYDAMDAQRIERGLTWPQVAAQLWEQSSELNRQRQDHPITPATLKNIGRRGDATCQHALFILRWLGRSPESFIAGAGGEALPNAGPGRRPRWNLRALYDALNTRRVERRLAWRDLARQLRCTEHQLRGIRTARFAIGMNLAMTIVQWLERPAADFIYAADW